MSDLAALYAIISGENASAPMPADVEIEWAQQSGNTNWTKAQGWHLTRRNGELGATHGGSSHCLLFNQGSYRITLENFKDVLNTIQSRRSALKSNITLDQNKVNLQENEYQYINDRIHNLDLD